MSLWGIFSTKITTEVNQIAWSKGWGCGSVVDVCPKPSITLAESSTPGPRSCEQMENIFSRMCRLFYVKTRWLCQIQKYWKILHILKYWLRTEIFAVHDIFTQICYFYWNKFNILYLGRYKMPSLLISSASREWGLWTHLCPSGKGPARARIPTRASEVWRINNVHAKHILCGVHGFYDFFFSCGFHILDLLLML